MTYNEADHPRDRKGRWVSAGGGGKDEVYLKGRVEKTEEKSPAEILYGKSWNKQCKKILKRVGRKI